MLAKLLKNLAVISQNILDKKIIIVVFSSFHYTFETNI